MLCRQLDKDSFELVRKDIQERRPEKMRTEKLNRIVKKYGEFLRF